MAQIDQKISAAGETDAIAAGTIPEQGKITLIGIVNSESEKEAVEQAVRSCSGISYVENKIQILSADQAA